MEISKKTRRDYDKPARPRREYDGKPHTSRRDDTSEHPHKAASSREAQHRKPYGEHKPYGERKPYGEHKAASGEHKPYGEHKAASGEHRTYGERSSFSDRKSSFHKAADAPKPRRRSADAPATEVRLNKFIANSGVCSRREADRLIQAGVVTVNGVVVTELGTKVDVRRDTVLFGDQKLKGEEKVYIIMNKPKGFVTTTSDPHADQTVMDLLTKCPTRVFPVGRLDKNTTGVLLFTNDGEMSEKLTHPSFNKKKIYEVTLDRKISREDFDRILSGINLEDGPIKADELDFVDSADQRVLGIEIHSGKNRIVRRIFESLGYQVKALDRVYFAGLTKKGIKRGQWRYLSEGEVNLLKMGAFN